MNKKIITALDFFEYAPAADLVDRLENAEIFKVGLQAYLKMGEKLISYLEQKKKKVFLDLKFKDIPNTVAQAVRSVSRFNPYFLTIHLSGGAEMIRQAAQAAEGLDTTVLGVTVLTSMNDRDLADTGVTLSAGDTVLKLCQLGLENGVSAFVCSPLEIAPLKKEFGRDITLVTPGIRPEWAARGDQKRIMTPAQAVRMGADYLVIGRPITGATDPAQAFMRIAEELA